MKSRIQILLPFIATVVMMAALPAASSNAAVGLKETKVTFTNAANEPASQGGAHPYSMNVGFAVNTVEEGSKVFPDEALKDAVTLLPPGVVAKATATPRCTGPEFATINQSASQPECPNASAVGIAHVRVALGVGVVPAGGFAVPIYNLVPGPGSVLKLGFVVFNVPVTVEGTLSQVSPYNAIGAALNVPQAVSIFSTELNLWGEPSDPTHDTLRGHCVKANGVVAHYGEVISTGSCPVAAGGQAAFLTMPTNCARPLQSVFEADSWQHPAPPYSFQETVPTRDSSGNPLSPTGCDTLGFDPRVSLQPTSPNAESPTGLDFDLNVDDPGLVTPGGVADSGIEKAVVTLPEGVTTNPSVASGLGACGLHEYESESIDTTTGCPESSKIGSVEIETPLLEKEASEGGGLTILHGSIYVARQHENPFDNLLTIYMVIRDPELGIFIKLPGKVEPDPSTGQLRTTFGEPGYELPDLPFSHFRLHFFAGERAPLTTPPTCGTFTTRADLYPYSAPGSPRTQTATFTISEGANGSGCASSPGALPNSPSFSAGTMSPQAGAYSPFVLRLEREDGTQQFSSIATTLPSGLIGRVAGIPYCPEADLAHAASLSGEGQGSLERAAASCPASSQVGTVTVASGAGSQPLYVGGRAYLAGPYKGAPLSLEIVTPAIAGPFDLGVVAVRTALRVDPFTARITAESDPIPTILHGLPLDVRSIALDMDRNEFTLNPTSCEPKAITGSELSTLGSTASLSQYFQVTGCAGLRFAPKTTLTLEGGTTRTAHPALKATLTYPKGGGYANIASAQVALPKTEFLDQGNLSKTCTKPVLLAGACPAKSIYGKARAWTPLLEKPLQGNVYLVGGFGYELPALVAELNGQIRVLLVGRVDSDKQHGIRATFESVPDAPVSKFELQMKGGGSYGLLINSEDICKKPQYATARFGAQNGRSLQLRPRIANSCKKSAGKKTKKSTPKGRSHSAHHSGNSRN